MATVYSLVCFGGLAGKTVTFTDSGDVVNLATHGMRDGAGVEFSTTGSLPTFSPSQSRYYIRQGADAGKFILYDTSAHAIAGGATGLVTFSGTGSGTHTVKGAYFLDLTTVQKARYGASGSERIYDGIFSWLDARQVAGTSLYDSEVCEIGDNFTETRSTTSPAIDLPVASILITSSVGGIRSPAFHAGSTGNGYLLNYSASFSGSALKLNTQFSIVNGIRVLAGGTSSNGFSFIRMFCTVCNSIVFSNTLGGNYSGTVGIFFGVPGCQAYNNIVYNMATGISLAGYGGSRGTAIYNNTCVRNKNGFSASNPVSTDMFIHNNISVGNTVANWVNNYVPTCISATANAGEETDFKAVTFSNSSGLLLVTLAGHGITAGTPVRFIDGGSAVAPTGLTFNTIVYLKTVVSTDTFTVALSSGGTAISYTDAGSGTIKVPFTWGLTGSTDITMATTDFADYSNLVLYPASASSPQVNSGIPVYNAYGYDIVDAVRPNYEPSTHPDEIVDVGAFEYDHGNGLAPATVTISINGMANGSEFAIYKTSDMSEIAAPQSTTGTYSASYTYTADTNIIVRVRKGTAATKYLPYEYAGTITSAGFALTVAQIPDTIA
ncbi:MAG: hypothetical protein EHM79_02225 [Geobacter sp.]|nr:MAG: hypothetical protein EHM79_02225 [Geobacter sp.]